MVVLVTCKYEEDPIKNEGARGDIVVEIFMFECVNRRTHARADGRRLESHPISPPCEPVAQVS